MEQSILDYLVDKYSPSAVILTGSRAAGLNRPTSDWDIHAFVDKPFPHDTSRIQEQFLDVEFVATPVEQDFILRTRWAPIRYTKVLLDSADGTAAKICNNTKEAYLKGPEPLASLQRSNRENTLNRILARCTSSPKPTILLYHLGFLYELAIRYWFEFQGIWSLPMYEAIDFVTDHDSHTSDLLTRIGELPLSDDRLKGVCSDLVDIVISKRDNNKEQLMIALTANQC